MTEVVKVFTPVKRVPIMIGKAPNGRKIPFGPYTLPQVGIGMTLLLATAIFALAMPINPAASFCTGLAITIVAVFATGLVPYTGVRLTSRVLWLGRLVVVRKPVWTAGSPVAVESGHDIVFVDQTVVVVLPPNFQSALEGAG